MKLSAAIKPCSFLSSEITGKTLVIPIYQRLFVWGDEQIDNLLNDLWVSCKNENSKKTDYYLGVITIHEDEQGRWEIVDGQQRLTFLTLLGCLLIKSRKNVENAGWDTFVCKDSTQTNIRLFFNGRGEDRKDIQKYMSAPIDESVTFSNSAFERFAERFRLFAEGKNESSLGSFSEYCFRHAAFLVNELPAAYGPEELNLYFEMMNSTGRQLSPLEVVKGKWFSPYAARWNQCMNFDKKFVREENVGSSSAGLEPLNLQHIINEDDDYKNIWALDRKTGSDTPSTSRLVMLPEVLALHVLYRMKIRNKLAFDFSFNRHKLIGTFQRAFDEPKAIKGNDYLDELELYREWIDKNIIYLRDDGDGYDYLFRGEKVDETDCIIGDTAEKRRMRQFQSMLYVSSGETQEWVLKMYLERNGEDLRYDVLRKAEAKWPTLPITPETIETMHYPSIPRYWFWKLDYLLWENHEDNKNNDLFFKLKEYEHIAIRKYVFRANRSLEHLHPQSKGDENWGCRDNPQAPMHQFGNLAMISIPSNSAQSDDDIEVKFGRVKSWLSDGRLESIKMLLMFKQCDGNKLEWTPVAAKQHCDRMVRLLEEDRTNWLGNRNDNNEANSNCNA